MSQYALSPGQALAIGVLGLSAVAAFGLAPDTTLDATVKRTVVGALALPATSRTSDGADLFWREERVLRGDTIGSLLARATVDAPAALAYLRTNASARPLHQLRPRRPVRVAIDDEGHMLALRFMAGNGELLEITRQDSTFAAARAPPAAEVRPTLRAGEIESSLFGAADDIGLPDAITMALAEAFAGDIDFLHDLRPGDRSPRPNKYRG